MKKIALMILVGVLLTLTSCAQQPPLREWPVVGMNAAWNDFVPTTPSFPFTNTFKVAGVWEGEFKADENGYPKVLEPGQVATVSVLENNGYHCPIGDYTLMWDGSGELLLKTCEQEFRFGPYADKKQIIPITQDCKQTISLTILATDKDDNIRNIRLYLPGYDDASPIWTDHYVDEMKHYELLRYMWGSGAWCYMDTVRHWNERRKPDDYHWMGGDEELGIPYEAMVELANRTGADLWVCVPHAVTDDFMRSMANFICDNLDPQLRFWVEYTNEHWLDIDFFIIAPNDWLQDQIATNPAYKDMTVPELYAHKAINLFEQFTDVFTARGQQHRLVRAICGHAAKASILQQTTDEIENMGKMDLVDVFGIGPYFRAEGPEIERFVASLDQGWPAIFESVDRTLDDMFDPEGYVGKEIYANAALAVKYDKPLVTYEAGQHYASWTNTPADVIAPMNRRPEMYDVYIKFMNEWSKLPNASTNVLFAAYTQYNHDEAFGMMEYYDQPLSETPKRRAVRDWLQNREEK